MSEQCVKKFLRTCLVSSGRLESWWNFCTQEASRALLWKTSHPEPESLMSSAPLTPAKQAEIDDLARAIREAVDAEIHEMAAHLATTDDAHTFGDDEFKIRALAHRIAAKAFEQHLQKKRI
jgi:hypothetical protein